MLYFDLDIRKKMEEFRRLHQMVAPNLLWFENSGLKFILNWIELSRFYLPVISVDRLSKPIKRVGNG